MTRTILYFTDNTGFGGTERMLLELLAGLDRGRWRPVLIHRSDPRTAQLVEGARQLDVRTWAWPEVNGRRADIRWVPEFTRRLRAERPAVFHAHLVAPLDCTYGLLSAALARVPVIVATQQLFVGTLSWLRLLQNRIVSMTVDRYIAVSHDMARAMRPTCLFPARKIQVIHNATPLAPFDRPVNPALRATLAQSIERPIVLSLARLDTKKGLRYLLEAAALVPEAQFVIAGGGRERASLETQARALGVTDRVVFLGHRDDIPDLLASCDLFVLPSLYEGLPVSVLEAMAAGKPVVASAIGGTDEAVLEGETGLLVPPRDPAALATAIRTVLSDPVLAQRLGAAGRARANQEFSVETMVERTTQVYEELLVGRETPHERMVSGLRDSTLD